MVLRGLKALIRKAPGKLVRARAYTAYRAIGASGKPHGPNLRGVARRLGETVFSAGELSIAPSSRFKGKTWSGPDGGIRRGKAVDAQVSRLAKASAAARAGGGGPKKKKRLLRLTSHFFAALQHHGLEPFEAQRVVLDLRRGIATAVDVVCQRGADELVLVELKTGYLGNRAAPVLLRGAAAHMQRPLQTAVDCALHRHLAQLAATHALFCMEDGTAQALKRLGIERVSGALLYVDDDATELHELSEWWRRRGQRLLDVTAR